MKAIQFLSSLFCAASLLSCNDDSAEKSSYTYEETIVDLIPQKTPIKLSETQKSLVNSCNDFSFNFFRSSNASAASKVLSPLSVSYILGMLNDGADGATADEITNLLGFSQTDKTIINEFYANMIENAPKVDPNVKISISNGIFVNENHQLHKKYLEDMQKYYNAAVQYVDFSSPSATQTINGWAGRLTDGRISEVEGMFGQAFRTCWLNITSFNATWTDQFDPKDTKVTEFQKLNGETTAVPMMRRKALCLYDENPLYSTVCLPYSSGAFSMYILLPQDSVNIGEVIRTLNTTTWNDMLRQMAERKGTMLDLSIPRFTSSFQADLTDMLKSMGMRKAFEADAEFPFMSAEKMSVSKIKQMSTIEVDEQGTKTATVSVAEALYSATEAIPFHAARPFIYLIQENTSGAIFFVGTYMGD